MNEFVLDDLHQCAHENINIKERQNGCWNNIFITFVIKSIYPGKKESDRNIEFYSQFLSYLIGRMFFFYIKLIIEQNLYALLWI